jgi:hypothetical protein
MKTVKSYDFWGTLFVQSYMDGKMLSLVYNKLSYNEKVKFGLNEEEFIELRFKADHICYQKFGNPTLTDFYTYMMVEKGEVGVNDDIYFKLLAIEEEVRSTHFYETDHDTVDQFIKECKTGKAIIMSDYYSYEIERNILSFYLEDELINKILYVSCAKGCSKFDGGLIHKVLKEYNVSNHIDDNTSLAVKFKGKCKFEVYDKCKEKILPAEEESCYYELGKIGGNILKLAVLSIEQYLSGMKDVYDQVILIGRDFGYIESKVSFRHKYIKLNRDECAFINELEYEKGLAYLIAKGFEQGKRILVCEFSSMNLSVYNTLKKFGFIVDPYCFLADSRIADKTAYYRSFRFTYNVCAYEYITSAREECFNIPNVELTQKDKLIIKGINKSLIEYSDIMRLEDINLSLYKIGKRITGDEYLSVRHNDFSVRFSDCLRDINIME